MDIRIIKELLDRYIAGNASPAEQKLIEQWLEENDLHENEWGQLTEIDKSEWTDSVQNAIHQTISKDLPKENKTFIPLPWYRRIYFHLAAAVFIMMVAGGSWYFLHSEKEMPAVVQTAQPVLQNDALPGTNKATLTLADGGKVELTDSVQGVLAKQGNTEITKNGAQLVYNGNMPVSKGSGMAYNTLTTPRGGQYNLVLPDGSKVWLNASSSLRYPVAFAEGIREVEIKGEAYFEVATQIKAGKKIPFNVQIYTADGMQKSTVEVLGTHFNINAYDDEVSTNTTLLEGKVVVKVDGQKNAATLAPGQQARISNISHAIRVIEDANIEETVAWKNGLFMMNKADIPLVLRQLSRWYDVEIMYSGPIPKGKISGDIPRHMKLSEVLKVMELSGVQFTIEGKKILVEE